MQGGHNSGPTLSPAPFGASWPCVPGELQQQWDTHRAPPAELGLGPPPQSHCVVPPPHVRVPGAGTRAPSAGWPRVEAQRCRLRPPVGRQQNTVYGSTQPARERGKAQSKAHPQLGSTSARVCSDVLSPCAEGWDGRTPEPAAGWHRRTPPVPSASCPQTSGSGAVLGAPPGRVTSKGGRHRGPQPLQVPTAPQPPARGGCAWGERGSPTALGASPACPGFVHPPERHTGWGCGSRADQGRGVVGQNWSGSASPFWRLRGVVPSTP